MSQSFGWKGLGVFERRHDVLCTEGQRGHLNEDCGRTFGPSWFSLLMFSVSDISLCASDDGVEPLLLSETQALLSRLDEHDIFEAKESHEQLS